MKTVTFTASQVKQLIAWINREKDQLTSLRALAGGLTLCKSSGSYEMIANDLQLALSLRDRLKSSGEDRELPKTVTLNEDELSLLISAGAENKIERFQPFWDGIVALLS